MQQQQNQCEIPLRDNHELDTSRRQFLLRSLLTTGLANVAPYLSLARSTDVESSIGVTITSRVEDIKVMSQSSYNVIRIHISTDIASQQLRHNVENVIYTFRNISSNVFEPFIYINRDKEDQWVFAYADDNEFLMEKIGGDDETAICQIHLEAGKRGMRSLARYADLLIDRQTSQ